MKQKLIILITVAISSFLSSQQLEYQKSNKILFEGNKISKDKVEEIMAQNTEALSLFKAGRTNRTAAVLMAFAGGFGIGYLGSSLYYGNGTSGSNSQVPGQIIAGVGGVGLIIGAFFVQSSGNKKLKKAINLYNAKQAFNNETDYPKTELQVVSNQNGLGLRLSF